MKYGKSTAKIAIAIAVLVLGGGVTALICSPAEMDESYADTVGENGDTQWSLDGDGKLTITKKPGSGDGKMTEVFSHDVRNAVKEVSVGSGVTLVTGFGKEDDTLHGSPNLTKVTLADSVVEIGPEAFYLCDKLSDIDFGGTKIIGNKAFAHCAALTSITNSTIERIGDSGFQDSGLISVTLNNVKVIGGYAFGYCNKLTSATLGDSSETVENFAFTTCKNLASMDLGGTKTIGQGAYDWCESLEEIDLVNVENLATYCFSTSGLKKATLGDNLKYLAHATFYYCKYLREVDLNKVEIIEEGAFWSCESLNSITLPATLTEIRSGPNGPGFIACYNIFEVVNLSGIDIDHSNKSSYGFGYARSIVTEAADATVKDIGGLCYGVSNDPSDLQGNGMINAIAHHGVAAVLPEKIEGEEYVLSSRFTVGRDTTSVFIPHGMTVSQDAFGYMRLHRTYDQYRFIDSDGNVIAAESGHFPGIPGSYFVKDSSDRFVYSAFGLEVVNDVGGTLVLRDGTGAVIASNEAPLSAGMTWSIDGDVLTIHDGSAVAYTVTATPDADRDFGYYFNHGHRMDASGTVGPMVISGMFTYKDTNILTVSADIDTDLNVQYSIDGVTFSEWHGSEVRVSKGDTFTVVYDNHSLPRDTRVVVDHDGQRNISRLGGTYTISDIGKSHFLRLFILDQDHDEYIEVTIGDSRGGDLVGPDSMVLENGAAWNVKGKTLVLSDSVASFVIKAKADLDHQLQKFEINGKTVKNSGTLHDDSVITGKFTFLAEDSEDLPMLRPMIEPENDRSLTLYAVIAAGAVAAIAAMCLLLVVLRRD